MTAIYVDNNTKINGSTTSTLDRVFGGVLLGVHNLKAGDQVTATVTRTPQGLLAESITTQAPATTSTSTQGTAAGSSATTTSSGRACVRDERPSQQGQIVCGELVR